MKSKRLTAVVVMMLSLIIMLGMFCLPASAATSLSKATVTYETYHTYTGKAIKPSVTVKVGKKKLSGKSYTVSYSNNKSVGKGYITIKGKGSYTGTVKKGFYIEPKAVSSLKATAYSTKIKLSWKAVTGARAYQVYQKIDGKWKKLDNTAKTSFTVTDLDSVTEYDLRVRAYAKTGSKTLYSDFKYISKSTTIGKATEMKASGVTQNSAKLTWNKVQGATSYRLTLTNVDTGFSETFTSPAETLELTSLYSHTQYSVKIVARNEEKGITGPNSVAFTFKTSPAAVKNLKAEAVSSTSVKLTWDKLSDIDSYQVFFSKLDSEGNPTTYTKFGNIKTNSCTVDTLSPCAYYSFRVRAYEKTDSGTVYSEYTVIDKVFTPVTKISGFKTTSVLNNEISLSWTRPSNIDGYKIYVDGELTETLKPAVTTYRLTGLSEGKTYKIAISAYYKEFEGEKTELSVTTSDGTVESVSFTSKPNTTLKPGETFQLAVSVTPSYAANKSVTYESRDTDIATVSSSGLITAKKDGKTIITATSVSNPSKSASFTLTVQDKPVLAEKITLPSTITLYEGDLTSLNPTFYPAETTDKRYTVTGSNYTYSYKEYIIGGLLGTSTKTDTCAFADYISISSNNLIKATKATVEPKTDNPFYFTVKVTAADGSGVSATTNIKILPKMIDVFYNGYNTSPWYYGNSAKLSYTLNDSIAKTYSDSDIRFKSSDTSIATVTNDGTVTCTGSGDVTITAYTSDNKYSGTFSIYSRGIVSVNNSFFSSCKAGKTYQIKAEILPAGSSDYIIYYSTDTSTATVDSTGLVTFKAPGHARILVSTSADSFNFQEVWLTSDSFTTPSGSNAQLLNHMRTTANSVKSLSDLPSITRYDETVMDDFTTSSKDIDGNELQSVFNSELAPKTTYLAAVSSSNSNYSTLKGKFIDSIPVKGQKYIISDTLSESDIKDIKVVDNGEYYYEMKLTLKEENMASLPASPASTRHGKVFDVLTSSYLNTYLEKINNSGSVTIKYDSFSQKYHDSTLTLGINKVTGNIEYANFDMNIDINISNLMLKITGLTTNMDVSFTCNNIVNIDFSGYSN